MDATREFFQQIGRELKNLPKLLPADPKNRDMVWGFILGVALMMLWDVTWSGPRPDNFVLATLQSPFIAMMLGFHVPRLVRTWRQTPLGAKRKRLLLHGVSVALFVFFVAVGSLLLLKFDAAVLQTLPFAVRFAIVVLLGVPAFFGVAMLAFWLSGATRWQRHAHHETQALEMPSTSTLQTLTSPSIAALQTLARPMTLRQSDSIALWCAWFYAVLFVAAVCAFGFMLHDGRFEDSLLTAVVTLWSGVAAPLMWHHARPLGTVSGARLRPRGGRAFGWNRVAHIEEQGEFTLFNETGARSLVFRDERGQALWQLPLDQVHADDKRALLALFPSLDASCEI